MGAADIDAQPILSSPLTCKLYSRDMPRQNAAPRDLQAVLALACGISIVAGAVCANALGIDMRHARSWLLGLLHRRARARRRARAQAPYPTHVVKIVLPVLPGSTTDILARLVADQLSQKWGKPVIVENMAGAAMNLGAEYVAHAAPDGYTLLLCPPAPLAIQQLLYHNLRYDPTKFVPIALLTKIANVLDVRPNFPADNVQGLIAYAKANPGKLTYASQGVGSTAQLSGGRTGSARRHQDGSRALSRRAAGAHRRDGRQRRHVLRHARDLGAALPRRQTEAARRRQRRTRRAPYRKCRPSPNQGLPGFRSITWFAIAGPPGLPAALADKINRDTDEILQKPEIIAKLRALQLDPMGGTTADAAKFIAEETQLWARVINGSHISLQ